MKYSAAIFDMDGLLLDTEQVCMTAFKQTCCEMNLPFKQEVYLSMIGRNQAGIKPIIKQGYGDMLDYSLFTLAGCSTTTPLLNIKPFPLNTVSSNY